MQLFETGNINDKFQCRIPIVWIFLTIAGLSKYKRIQDLVKGGSWQLPRPTPKNSHKNMINISRAEICAKESKNLNDIPKIRYFSHK